MIPLVKQCIRHEIITMLCLAKTCNKTIRQVYIVVIECSIRVALCKVTGLIDYFEFSVI